jgi:two-component system, response regulator PdtaR
MDIMLKGDIDGVEVAKEIKAKLEIPVIYLTAYSESKNMA